MGHGHRKRRQQHVDLATLVIHTVKTPVRDGVTSRDVITVVGKLFAGREARRFSDDFVTFDHELVAVGVDHDPFSAQQGDRAIGAIFNGDEIDKRVRLVGRERWSAVMIGKFVESGDKAGERAGTAGHQPRRLGM